MKRKQHMFLIVTTYILIIFLSSYFIIMPNINKIKEINNTKDLTYEEKSKLIDEVNKKYIVLELEVSDKYSALSSATKDKYNPLIEEVIKKYDNLETEITNKYDGLESDINKTLNDKKVASNNEFFASGFSKKYYELMDEVSNLENEKSSLTIKEFNEKNDLNKKKEEEVSSLKKSMQNEINSINENKVTELNRLKNKKNEEVKQINYRDITKRNNRSKCVRYILLGGIIILFPLIYIIVIYNRLTKLYNKVKESWSEVNIHLKERSDLIPNVVKTVKGYKNYEKDALIGIINARSEVLKAENKDETIRANEKLDNAISKLLVTIESYPELKSNENFMSLQDNLVDIENKISVSRSKYNKSVLNYKNKLEVFPSNIIASIFNFKQELFFEIEKEDKENPKTKF